MLMLIRHQFDEKMCALSAFLMHSVCFVTILILSESRAVKRIVEGEVTFFQIDYGTYFFVHLRRAFGCISNQQQHELGGCQGKGYCGGALFTPEFVITAAHCAFFYEFRTAKKSYEIYNQNALIGKEPIVSFNDLGIFGYIEAGVKTFYPILQTEHAFYSNIVLLAGSHNYLGMTQMRHTRKYLPHPYFSYGDFKMLDHDIALLRTCQPFDITATVKTVNMVPIDKLKPQWESIVKRSAACLYIGFGETKDPTTIYYINDMLDTTPTKYLRYAWRQLKCASKCNFDPARPPDQKRNPCVPCSDHIPPGTATPLWGDSGSPILCDGYFIGHHTAGHYHPERNYTQAWLYPLFCAIEAFSPERLEIYKTYPPRGYHPLIIR